MREHGTRARYVLGPNLNDEAGRPCRCGECREANRIEVAKEARLKAYGRWQPYVDAEPARRHVRMLNEYGIGWRRVAIIAGVSTGGVSKLIYGDGPRGMAPSKRIRPETAEKILAVQPSPEHLADTAHVDGDGTRRRIQALVVVGWSQRKIAVRLGVERSTLTKFMPGGPVYAGTWRRMCALFEELWDVAPPESDHRSKIAASRARNFAKAAGWLPPAAWDDDLIDLPEAELKAELARRVALMDAEELMRCHEARYRRGERSPLIAAAAIECDRRRHAAREVAA